MKIDIISLFPEMFSCLEHGVIGRAIRNGTLELTCWNPRKFTEDAHRTVDDRPYGGGPGMVMMVEPLREAIRAARAASDEPAHVVYLSPQGKLLNQSNMAQLAARNRLVLVSGRYEGVDERLIDTEIDEEISIGDYVLSGGELAAMVVIDAVARLLPGVLGHEQSAEQDSFVDSLLDCPHFTRPEKLDGLDVPKVLLSGDHQAIERWRLKQALGRTWLRRPDLLEKRSLSEQEQALLEEFKRENR